MYVGFRLKPGRDDHLIAALKSLPEYERSFYIRQALRAYFGGSRSLPDAPITREAAREPEPAIMVGAGGMTLEEAEKKLSGIDF